MALWAFAAGLAVFILVASGCVFAPAEQAAWPPSAMGLPVFYYFGDPG